LTTVFKTLKWCYLHDSDCKQYDMYCPDGDRIRTIHLTGNQKLYGVSLSNGKYDILKADTQIQVEKINDENTYRVQ